jgi:hypothetical protein
VIARPERKIMAKLFKRRVTGKRIGDLQLVDNLGKKPAAADRYNHIRIQFPDGSERHLLLTDHQVKVALDRARKNPEDLPEVSWLRDMFD